MNVRIGINPITWTNDDAPDLGGDTPLETCLSETRQAGYAGTELGGKFPREASVLKPILDGYGLALISGWYDGRCAEKSVEDEMEAITPHLTLLRDMGCRHVVYADTSLGRHGAIWSPISQRPVLPTDDMACLWTQADAAGREVRRVRRGHGLSPSHGHDRRNRRRSGAADEAYRPRRGAFVRYGSLGVFGGRSLGAGEGACRPDRACALQGSRRPILEKARATDMSFIDAVIDGIFTVPGDGFTDFPAILTVLHDAGYSGWMVVEAEQEQKKADPLTFATMGFEACRAWRRRQGLSRELKGRHTQETGRANQGYPQAFPDQPEGADNRRQRRCLNV